MLTCPSASSSRPCTILFPCTFTVPATTLFYFRLLVLLVLPLVLFIPSPSGQAAV